VKARQTFRYLVPVMGLVLLGWLVLRTGVATVLKEIETIGGALSAGPHPILGSSWRCVPDSDVEITESTGTATQRSNASDEHIRPACFE